MDRDASKGHCSRMVYAVLGVAHRIADAAAIYRQLYVSSEFPSANVMLELELEEA